VSASPLPYPAPRLGYDEADMRRLFERAGGAPIEKPIDIRRVLDNTLYLDDWRANYRIQSVRSSIHAERITCIDGAVLSYGLLELLFPDVKRRLLAIHRCDPKTGEECGHCVALFWDETGKVGSFSKSSYKGLGHRDPVYADESAVATSYAEAYVAMQFQPLYFGVSRLEEVAPDLDWRFHKEDLNAISDRLQATYEYGFAVE
jgi:hypothetical protein